MKTRSSHEPFFKHQQKYTAFSFNFTWKSAAKSGGVRMRSRYIIKGTKQHHNNLVEIIS